MSNVIQITRNAERDAESKPRESKIVTFLHCAMCLEEVPEGMSASEYAQTEVGFTIEGIQIWCLRHNANVVHLDFEGRLVPAIAG